VLNDFDAFNFEQGAAPPTVNPSLWRHAMLNAQIGLFKDGVSG
jgi:alkyl sulfatase BDS1-like metallo-beta-lactamase superfamily hydrolase